MRDETAMQMAIAVMLGDMPGKRGRQGYGASGLVKYLYFYSSTANVLPTRDAPRLRATWTSSRWCSPQLLLDTMMTARPSPLAKAALQSAKLGRIPIHTVIA